MLRRRLRGRNELRKGVRLPLHSRSVLENASVHVHAVTPQVLPPSLGPYALPVPGTTTTSSFSLTSSSGTSLQKDK